MSDQEPEEGSVTRAVNAAADGEHDAIGLLWSRFFERLSQYVQFRTYDRFRPVIDPEGVASESMYELLQKLKEPGFDKITSREDLWKWLAMFAKRNVLNETRKHQTQRRGGNHQHQSVDQQGTDIVADRSDPLSFRLLMEEVIQRMPNAGYREILMMRLAGFSMVEISMELDCSTRTVERRISKIADLLSDLK